VSEASTRREQVPAALAGERLDRVVAMISGRSRAEAAALVEGGAVKVGGVPATSRSARVGVGDELVVEVADLDHDRGLEADASVAVTVIHEDEHLLVVDKPAGVVVHPGAGRRSGTLVQGLLASYPELAGVGSDPARPGIVHRLDKGTSGLLLVARTNVAHERLVAALGGRRISRRYRTLVWDHPSAARGMVDAPVGRAANEPTRMTVTERGKPARTRYEVVRRFDRPVPVAELVCDLETGRTHQIRVHLRSIGHAVVGDARYGGARQSLPLARPFLHAEHLALDHPVSGAPLSFESPLPADLAEVLAQLS
jgi:23S rRNA pseudouridine1911/1915/1917 synthase